MTMKLTILAAALINNGSASDITIGPLISQLNTELNVVKVALTKVGKRDLFRRQTDSDVAATVASTVTVSPFTSLFLLLLHTSEFLLHG